MRVILIAIATLSFAGVPVAGAQGVPDTPAPEELQERVWELEALIDRLESRIGALQDLLRMSADPAGAKLAAADREPWRHRENWRRLRRGLTALEAARMLGTPGRVIATTDRIYWYYPDRTGGWVRLDHDGARVEAWAEPAPSAVSARVEAWEERDRSR